MNELAIFAAMALIAVGFSVRTLVQVVQRWGSLWDADLSREDAKLASSASFFLLVPPTVLLHELGHAIAVWSVGLDVEGFWFLGFFGAVLHAPSTDLGNFSIALAGNVVTLVIGVAAMVVGLQLPRHPVWNILWIELGRQSLLLVLIGYPLLCLVFPGDFDTIFDVEKTPVASSIAAVCHLAVLIVAYRSWKRVKSRARLLSSRQAVRFVDAERAYRKDPRDMRARRELGTLYFAAMDFSKARAHLDEVVAADKLDGQLRLIYGTLLTEQGDHVRAIPFLEQAREGLLKPEDREAAEKVLAQARALASKGALRA